jgi:hypothetical protein
MLSVRAVYVLGSLHLRLKSVEQRGRDALWIRYEVVRSVTAERRNIAIGHNSPGHRFDLDMNARLALL